ncbi:MAG: hypothetical protein QG577_1733 [Thermodesulfobacteriota bacterium]|nr:hypothetical protein [Thermodesulfobacteriota bacterium]
MPRFDRTGPLGAGPRTGWGQGRCVTGSGIGQGQPGAGVARGLGRGGATFGGGRGRCFGGPGLWSGQASQGAVMDSTEEVQSLRSQLEDAQRTVREMEARLAELEKSR